jgi:hypothetical protein
VRVKGPSSQSRFEAIEIIEAVILALVAVATAWSGYQAAQWAGKRAEQYAEATRLRVTAEGLVTLAGQERIYDSDTFNSWVAAKLNGKKRPRSSLSGAFVTNTAPHSQPGCVPILSRTRKRLRARSSCPSTTTPSTSSSLV